MLSLKFLKISLTNSTYGKYNPAKTVSYIYDRTGARTKMTDPAGNNIAYLYDAAGELTSVTEGGNSRAVYGYDAAGRGTRLTLGNDTYSTYAYDNANRLTSLYNRKSDNSVISSFDYLLDKAGNRTKMTLDGGDYVGYIYDGKYQLTSEARTGGTSYTRAFYYDPAGNRTRLVKNGPVTVTYAYDTADKLTKETEGETETTYLYDANGSLTRKTQGETIEAYGYNYDNMMTSYDGPGTDNDTTYTYDVGLKRIKKDVDGTVTKFIYETAPQFNELYPLTYVGENQFKFGVNILAEYDGSNNLQATYVNGLDVDQNIAKTISENTYYFLQDGLGSVRNLVDASEVAQNTYDYYAFGSDLGTPTENIANQFKFTAREWDAENSLYFYRTRHYAPKLGRFIQRDLYFSEVTMLRNELQRTVDQIRNLLPIYSYVNNNPLNQLDPLGEKTKAECQTDLNKCLFRAACGFAACTGKGLGPPFVTELACLAICSRLCPVSRAVCAACVIGCTGATSIWALINFHKCANQYDKDQDKCYKEWKKCLECAEDRDL